MYTNETINTFRELARNELIYYIHRYVQTTDSQFILNRPQSKVCILNFIEGQY